ncbi:MAG TPA: ABC transporter substrate-binding protein [Candidatus Limnocylindrales bacterium]|jgi:alpha-glucoside transport system substrate-binding protein
MESRVTRRLLVGLAALAIVVGACNTGGGGGGGKEVTVIGAWGGDEEKAFLEMVAPWEQQTGNKVKYTGTRDLNTILTTGVASGVLPDLAGLPGPGQMAEFARKGALKPLEGVLDTNTYKSETAPALVDLGTVDGKIVGVFIKSAVKGLIWYSPKNFQGTPPKTWDELQNIAVDATGNKWCVGLESGAASGWPGTDWIEDFVLRQSGPQVYNDWWAGKVKWSDPQIKSAFEAFGDVIADAAGGANGVLTTNFEVGGDGLFTDPPRCMFHHQASFITGLGGFKGKTAGTDYDFFPFPDINSQYSGAVEGAGDLFGMFHDTDAAKSLMKYLVTAPAQDIWVKKGGALSANKNATSYPDDIAKRSAALLTGAKSFVFDASDLMPTAMNAAFWKAMLDYTQDPSKLDSILADLDKVQADAYKPA